MSDPISHCTAALAGAACASMSAAPVLGEQFYLLGIAFLGGATALIYLERMDWFRMLLAVAGSTVIGVLTSLLATPLIIATAIHFLPWLEHVLLEAETPAKMMVAFWAGFLAFKTVPAIFRYIDSIAEKRNLL